MARTTLRNTGFAWLVIGLVGLIGGLLLIGGLIALLLLGRPAEQAAAALPSATPTPPPTATPTETPLPSPSPAPPTLTPPPPGPTPLPQPNPDGQLREIYVPILMYHYLSVPPPGADIYREDLSTTPEAFREQLGWLQQNGYQTLRLSDLLYALAEGRALPEKSVLLTFDDGYVDNYENAFPILQEFGYMATFFILTDVTDRQQPGYMTWDMYREMAAGGMDIQVHGREHFDYSGRDPDWLLYHLVGPAQTIEAELGYQPRFFSYPAGQHDETAIAALQEHGYWLAVTTVNGSLQSSATPYELRRIRISNGLPLATFAAMVSGS